MSFTSLEFIPFIFIAFVLFYITKNKARLFVLLVFNVLFSLTFVSWNIIVLLIFGLYSYFVALKINKKGIIIPIILVFIFFKYAYYFTGNILTPIGISFYTFKIISYLMDVYNKKIEAEKDILVYLNYVMFFPTLVSGPISRFKPFMESLDNKFDYKKSRDGAFLMFSGIFEKMVIADFLGILVNNIYDNIELTGIYVWIAIFLYALQIYVDFDSYSNIAIGASKIMGIEVGENFKTPYLSSNIKEFWRRWHISLSTWFKDYVYIPLGGNRKGEFRKHLNTTIVFVLSGIWHGSTINFLIWGLGHGLLQLIEDYYFKFYNTLKFNDIIKKINKIIGIVINYILVSILFVFFKIPKFEDAIDVFKRSFILSKFDYINLGLVEREWYYLLIMISVFVIIELIRYKYSMITLISERNIIIRWTVYVSMVATFLIFAIYGSQYNPADFIYKHF